MPQWSVLKPRPRESVVGHAQERVHRAHSWQPRHLRLQGGGGPGGEWAVSEAVSKAVSKAMSEAVSEAVRWRVR